MSKSKRLADRAWSNRLLGKICSSDKTIRLGTEREQTPSFHLAA